MNILVICREIPPVGGGAGHVALHLAEQMCEAGHSIVIVTMHFGDLPIAETRGGIAIRRVPCGRKHQDSSYYLEMLRFLYRARSVVRGLIEEQGCDLIHAHAIVPDGVIGCGYGLPLVITAHGSDVPGYNPDKFGLGHKLVAPVWHRTLAQAARLVTPSEALAELIRKQRPDQSIIVVPNGIDIETFTPGPKDESFLICSRLVRRKNYQLFIKALRGVEQPQTLHVVGEGPMLPELKELAAACPQHEILFHGWLANGSEAWRRLYENCRYFVFPSESENFPINLLEAQLAGMVVLASPIPGNREVLGEEAVYFDAISEAAVAAKLATIIDGRLPHIDSIGARARDRVRSLFSWPTVAARYGKIYADVLGAHAVG